METGDESPATRQPAMTSTTLLHSEDLLTLVEGDNASVINGITAAEIADFRHQVRYAAIGAVLQTKDQNFSCVAWHAVDDSRIYALA